MSLNKYIPGLRGSFLICSFSLSPVTRIKVLYNCSVRYNYKAGDFGLLSWNFVLYHGHIIPRIKSIDYILFIKYTHTTKNLEKRRIRWI